MHKRSLYIFVFAVAGAMTGVFIALVFIAWVLDGGSLAQQVQRLLSGLPKTAGLLGGGAGLLLGKFFWPRLYNEDGSLRFHDWKTFRKWLHRKPSGDSVRRHAK